MAKTTTIWQLFCNLSARYRRTFISYQPNHPTWRSYYHSYGPSSRSLGRGPSILTPSSERGPFRNSHTGSINEILLPSASFHRRIYFHVNRPRKECQKWTEARLEQTVRMTMGERGLAKPYLKVVKRGIYTASTGAQTAGLRLS